MIVIYGGFAYKYKPYNESFINEIDVYSTYCSAASILIGVFIHESPYDSLQIIWFILLIILNAFFIIGLLIKIASGYIHKIKGIKKTVIEFLASKIGFFKRFLPKKEQKKPVN